MSYSRAPVPVPLWSEQECLNPIHVAIVHTSCAILFVRKFGVFFEPTLLVQKSYIEYPFSLSVSSAFEREAKTVFDDHTDGRTEGRGGVGAAVASARTQARSMPAHLVAVSKQREVLTPSST